MHQDWDFILPDSGNEVPLLKIIKSETKMEFSLEICFYLNMGLQLSPENLISEDRHLPSCLPHTFRAFFT
jgi:hypothetical protein